MWLHYKIHVRYILLSTQLYGVLYHIVKVTSNNFMPCDDTIYTYASDIIDFIYILLRYEQFINNI